MSKLFRWRRKRHDQIATTWTYRSAQITEQEWIDGRAAIAAAIRRFEQERSGGRPPRMSELFVAKP